MAKIDISDAALLKLADDTTKARIKELEKQVRSLERKLETRDRQISSLKRDHDRESAEAKRRDAEKAYDILADALYKVKEETGLIPEDKCYESHYGDRTCNCYY
jgi:septal ring factor EnvC (AmiA/AmiB activator)